MIFGIPLSFVAAVAVYMVSTVVGTEIFKAWAAENGIRGLVLSWIVGAIIFAVMDLAGFFDATPETVFVFVVLTGLLNAAYKFAGLRKLVRALLKKWLGAADGL